MCIPRTYWTPRGVDKDCGTFTREEVHEAYKDAYKDHIKNGSWTFDQFIEWFPSIRAEMTKEEVLEFAESIR